MFLKFVSLSYRPPHRQPKPTQPQPPCCPPTATRPTLARSATPNATDASRTSRTPPSSAGSTRYVQPRVSHRTANLRLVSLRSPQPPKIGYRDTITKVSKWLKFMVLGYLSAAFGGLSVRQVLLSPIHVF